MTVKGDYTKALQLTVEELGVLKKLVGRQRRLEGAVAAAEADVLREKATRDEIDALLRKGGLEKSEAVLCNGYVVTHNERAGQSRINADKLRGAGVAEVDIAFATDCGKPSYFATVKPAKGAKVRR